MNVGLRLAELEAKGKILSQVEPAALWLLGDAPPSQTTATTVATAAKKATAATRQRRCDENQC
jgi:hypothetical protein